MYAIRSYYGLRFYAAGDSMAKPADGRVEHLHIIKQGHVLGQRPSLSGNGIDTTMEVAPGECFPMAAMVVGSQARILYSDEEGRKRIALAFNDAIVITSYSIHYTKLYEAQLIVRNDINTNAFFYFPEKNEIFG